MSDPADVRERPGDRIAVAFADALSHGDAVRGAITEASVCRTPFGADVVPEV